MYKIIKRCSIDEINDRLKDLKQYGGRIFLFRQPEENEYIGSFKVFLYKKISKCYLVYKDLQNKGKILTFEARLDKEFDGVAKTGAEALKILQHYYKAPYINTKDNAPFSIGISPYRNKKYVGKRAHNIYGYDLNSAYPYGMLQDIPDTTKPLGAGIVNEGEYGFMSTGDRASIGIFAIYRFPIMKESPYKKFIECWYNKKKNANNISDKNTAKFVMNAAIGALQNHNCFIRAAIINNFHSYITNIFRKYKSHILSTNVDSIVSDIKIPEIENNLGDNIGQWKLEHFGDYAIAENGYSVQWNKEKPKFGAGIPTSWFKNEFDILKDEIPVEHNKYDIDSNKILITEIKYDN